MSAEARPDRNPVGRDRLHRLRRPRHHPPLEGFHHRSRQVQNQSLLLNHLMIEVHTQLTYLIVQVHIRRHKIFLKLEVIRTSKGPFNVVLLFLI